jgi:ABC-type transport system involved in cytochrome bd biosynthesis fused ATPase/permease subunit
LPVTIAVLLFSINSFGQIDQRRVDSLARLIDSSAEARQRQQETTIKRIDSSYHSELKKALQQNPADSLAKQKQSEAKQRQQFIVRILTGVLIFTILIITLVRTKKPKP